MSTLGPYIFTEISLRMSIWTSRPTIEKVDVLGQKLYKLSAYERVYIYILCNLKQISNTHPICNTRALLERSVESSAVPFFFETSVCSQGESLDTVIKHSQTLTFIFPRHLTLSQSLKSQDLKATNIMIPWTRYESCTASNTNSFKISNQVTRKTLASANRSSVEDVSAAH